MNIGIKGFLGGLSATWVAVAVALIAVGCGENTAGNGGGGDGGCGAVSKGGDGSDGGPFKTVTIGEQVWMAKNLNIKTDESCCYGYKESNCDKYGRLYTWAEAMEACPAGWHLPSYQEWRTLVDYVGGPTFGGKKLKSKCGWNISDEFGKGTDEYGFSALPGGYFHCPGAYCPIDTFRGDTFFGSIGSRGRWWTATEINDEYTGDSTIYAENWMMHDFIPGVSSNGKTQAEKGSRYSVRCVLGDAPVQ